MVMPDGIEQLNSTAVFASGRHSIRAHADEVADDQHLMDAVERDAVARSVDQRQRLESRTIRASTELKTGKVVEIDFDQGRAREAREPIVPSMVTVPVIVGRALASMIVPATLKLMTSAPGLVFASRIA